MKIILLDGEKINNINDVHETFSTELSFPTYYGKNLDALHDCITDLRNEKIGVIIVNAQKFEKALGRRYKSFMGLMDDLCGELSSFRLLVEPFSDLND